MKNKPLLKQIISFLFLGGTSGAMMFLPPETINAFIHLFSEAGQSQIAQMGFFFTLASLIHSGRMKKEIRANFEALTVAINNLGTAFREDLKIQRERLDNLASRVEDLETERKAKPIKEEIANA